MQIGNYEVYAIECERFALDGGAMFGTVPKALWEKAIPADEKNRIDMSARAMLIKGNGKTILVDTGMGQKWAEKPREMYKISDSYLEANLKKFGVAPGDITDVILTHLHFDHAGGATKLVDGKLVPTFSKATYYVQEENFKWASKPNAREKASYLKENFMPLVEAGKLVFTNGETELFPNIHLHISNAHTHAQQLVRVSGEGDHGKETSESGKKKSVLYCADLIPTAAHISLPWVMGYDLYPLEIMEEKRKMLERAVDESWTLFFEHDPYQDASSLVQSEKGIAKGEKIFLN